MTIGTIIVLVIFSLVWLWIVYEMYMAPEVDNNGNIIEKNDVNIDITEEDIMGDLGCIYKGDEGEEKDGYGAFTVGRYSYT